MSWSPGLHGLCEHCKARLLCMMNGHVGEYCVVCHFAYQGLRHCRVVQQSYRDFIRVAEDKVFKMLIGNAWEDANNFYRYTATDVHKWKFRSTVELSTVDLGICACCFRDWLRMTVTSIREEVEARDEAAILRLRGKL